MGHLAETIKHLDESCFRWINLGLHNPFFDRLMPLFSYAGQAGLVWVALSLFFFFYRRGTWRNAAILMLAALLASYLVDEGLLKNIFHRPRPFETLTGVDLLIPPPNSYSFPSGHAASSFAAGLVLARKMPPAAVPALTLAFLIAFSRVYVGVHYPLDVLAGAIVGAACAFLLLKMEKRIF
ncbi:MAG: Undecaprenyl-diphosphatase BcrC [Firmicutes bacterium ADurb.Bin456]|nr:MAG: Undecaprenyl-diphosphatase BcrC [Firmicutes bacterium ADurb.Bin456]